MITKRDCFSKQSLFCMPVEIRGHFTHNQFSVYESVGEPSNQSKDLPHTSCRRWNVTAAISPHRTKKAGSSIEIWPMMIMNNQTSPLIRAAICISDNCTPTSCIASFISLFTGASHLGSEIVRIAANGTPS